jgi:hypothetical protein
MHPQPINLLYTKEHSDLQIEVIGIPANTLLCRRLNRLRTTRLARDIGHGSAGLRPRHGSAGLRPRLNKAKCTPGDGRSWSFDLHYGF